MCRAHHQSRRPGLEPAPILRGGHFYRRYLTPTLLPICHGVWVPAPDAQLRIWAGTTLLKCLVQLMHAVAISPRNPREFFSSLPPSPIRGRRERRVRAAPAVSCANMHKKTHTSIQVQRRHPAFPAQWFYGLFRALPGERAFLPPSPPRSLLPRNLTPASGRQDHTTSPSASGALRRCAPSASTASRLTSVTIAKRPSERRDGASL